MKTSSHFYKWVYDTLINDSQILVKLLLDLKNVHLGTQKSLKRTERDTLSMLEISTLNMSNIFQKIRRKKQKTQSFETFTYYDSYNFDLTPVYISKSDTEIHHHHAIMYPSTKIQGRFENINEYHLIVEQLERIHASNIENQAIFLKTRKMKLPSNHSPTHCHNNVHTNSICVQPHIWKDDPKLELAVQISLYNYCDSVMSTKHFLLDHH
ncbi:hypothetical protein AGLY_008882 [Aphis glycines]|uniref:Uncharacterized protein n=1 Tax=Aphis glycines TaxID=307491 RepID=A0A6G0TJD2_APHGL|nr:hypothetical protein AGLY_008882 [Aphis glycines]